MAVIAKADVSNYSRLCHSVRLMIIELIDSHSQILMRKKLEIILGIKICSAGVEWFTVVISCYTHKNNTEVTLHYCVTLLYRCFPYSSCIIKHAVVY